MKRNSLFLLLLSLGLFGIFVDDGASGGADDDEGDDFDIDDEPTPPKKDETPQKQDETQEESQKKDDDKTTETLEELKARLEATEKIVQEQESQKALNEALGELEAKHKGFDREKVKAYLQKLHETDPDKANELNSKTGWELVWVTELKPKDVNNDEFNPARNVDAVDRSQEILEAVSTGTVTLADEQNVMSKFL